MHRKDKHEGRKAKSAAAAAATARARSREAGGTAAAAAVACPYCKKKFKQWQYLNVHKKKCAAAKLQYQVSRLSIVHPSMTELSLKMRRRSVKILFLDCVTRLWA